MSANLEYSSSVHYDASEISKLMKCGFVQITQKNLLKMLSLQSKANEPEEITDKKQRPKNIMKTAKQHFAQGLYEDAIPLLEQVQDRFLEAVFLLGIIYFDGLGVEVDTRLGVRYMKQVASAKDISLEDEPTVKQAQYNLGLLYYRGGAVPQSNEEAERYWLLAASTKHHPATVKAQAALGMFYSHPDTHDVEKAFHWHSKAVEFCNLESEGALGVMFLYGFGTKKDPIRAYGFLVNASIKGSRYAMGYLTAFYYVHQLFNKVVQLGTRLYEEADDLEMIASETKCEVNGVKQGIALGCFYLALCTQYGTETKKDLDEAKTLIVKAVSLAPNIGVELHVKAILGTA